MKAWRLELLRRNAHCRVPRAPYSYSSALENRYSPISVYPRTDASDLDLHSVGSECRASQPDFCHGLPDGFDGFKSGEFPQMTCAPGRNAVDFRTETAGTRVGLVPIPSVSAARSLRSGANSRRRMALTNELDLSDVRLRNGMLATGTWLGDRDDAGHLAVNRRLRTVVLVSGCAPHAQSLDALLVATSDYDVIFVESIAHSYSCVKKVVPDLVIISAEVDDVATCQLLSMLRADRRSSGIPVLTYPTFREQHDLDDDLAGLDQETSTQSLAAPMN